MSCYKQLNVFMYVLSQKSQVYVRVRGNTPLPQSVEALSILFLIPALILWAPGRTGRPLIGGRAGLVRSAARLCSPDRPPLGDVKGAVG